VWAADQGPAADSKGSAMYNYDSVKIGIKATSATRRCKQPIQREFQKRLVAAALAAAGLANTTIKGTP